LVAEEFIVIGQVPETVAHCFESNHFFYVITVLFEMFKVLVGAAQFFEALKVKIGVGVVVFSIVMLLFH
jgi:hypothetical protein